MRAAIRPLHRLQIFGRIFQTSFLIPATVPHKGTLRRCPHSVYWPDGDAIAFYCGACNPLGSFPDVGGKIVLPLCARQLNDAGRLYANKRQPGACPKCLSFIHIVVSETTDPETYETVATWRCADCDHVFEHISKPRIPGEYVSTFDLPTGATA